MEGWLKNRNTKFKCFDHLDGTLCQNLPWYKKYHDSKFINIVHSLFFILFLVGVLGGISYTAYITDINTARAAVKTWDGGGTDMTCGVGNSLNWSCEFNWSDDTVPLATDSVVFDSSSTKDSIIDPDFHGSVIAVDIESSYTGTITMERSLAVTGSPSITNHFKHAGGTFDAGVHVLEVYGVFIHKDNFIAPSTRLILRATANFDAGFIHNGGTVAIENPTNGNSWFCDDGVVFNLVDLSFSSGASRAIINCNLNLGDDPSIGLDLTLSGGSILNGTGTLSVTKSLALSNFLGGFPNIVGFSGLVSSPDTVIDISSGNVVDFSSYSTFEIGGIFGVGKAGTAVALPNNAQICTLFVANNTIFTAPAETLDIGCDLTIASGATFNHNNGTIVIDGQGTQSIACNTPVIFNLVVIGAADEKNITGCQFNLGHNPTIDMHASGATIFLSGGASLSGTGTLTFNGGNISTSSSSSLQGFTGFWGGSLFLTGTSWDFSELAPFRVAQLLNVAGSFDVVLPNNADIGELNIGPSGTVTAPSGTLNIRSNWVMNPTAAFNHNNGTVVFTSSTNNNILSSTTFYNLHKLTPGTLTFTAGTTQTILGELKLQGEEGNPLILKSSVDGNEWFIDPQGTFDISYVDVKDSNNINAQALVALNSTDAGNNINWEFPEPPVDPEEPEEPEEPTDPEEPNAPEEPTTPTTASGEEKPDNEKPKPTPNPGQNEDNGQKPTPTPETPEQPEQPSTPGEPETPGEQLEEPANDIKSSQYSWMWWFLVLLLLALIIWAIKREHDAYRERQKRQ